MTLRLLFLLLLTMLSMPAAFAQGTDDSLKDVPPAYLKEMDHFYTYCTHEDVFAKNYDCRCLSVKYLDMRKQNGADVTTADILNDLRRQCLRDPNIVPDLPANAANLGGITNDQFDEAKQFFQSCTGDRQLSLAYDCECLASNYLDERIKRGPEPPQTALMGYIGNTCPNVTAMAGMAYKSCFNMGPLMPVNQPLDQFCTCYANTFAKMYGESKAAYSSDLRVTLQTRAMDQCKNPR